MHAQTSKPLAIALLATHQIYTHEAEDGTRRAWDVTCGMQIAQDGRAMMLFPLAEHGVTVDLIHELYQGLDEAYAMTCDLTKPLLIIPFFGECLILDGWHRLFAAARLGVAELPMFLLTQAEADAIKVLELPPGHSANGK